MTGRTPKTHRDFSAALWEPCQTRGAGTGVSLPCAILYVNSGKFRVKTEADQQIWNECSRLIAYAIIYYNTLILSRVGLADNHLRIAFSEAVKVLMAAPVGRYQECTGGA